MVEPHGWSELSEGDQFAGYRIERRLGRGGMGILYLAVEPGLERRVALKLIAPEAAADDVFAQRFAEESRIAASIEHPNVVPIYAAGEERGVPFIAMRYVAGSDLGRRLVRENRLEPARAAALIAQVGNGLDAIHAAGLVHRDVKPANVLLSGEDEAEHAYLTDFGVARNVATESGLTQTGRFVGTLDYVAPEQISGGAVDARVDVYALGCLLFKLLTGEVPFPREGEAARLYAHLNDPPPAPSLYAQEVSMALDDVVLRAMSKEPGDRYPSAGDLGRAAVAAVSGSRVAVPERTVATGAAATRESRKPVAPEASPPAAPEPTAATGRLEPRRAARSGERDGRRRLLLPIGGLLAVAAVVLALVALSGPDGGGTTTTTGGTPSGLKAAPKETKPQRQTLSRAELIRRADAICEDSQNTYKSVFSRLGEESPDVGYAATLVGISTPAIDRFRKLVPPAAMAADWERYLAAQERVGAYDREALRAAKAEDPSAYAAAREKRDREQAQRYDLARALDLRQCSATRG